MTAGKVLLVGAGPGDPELLTLKAARAIAEAEVIVYDRLVPEEVLALIPTHGLAADTPVFAVCQGTTAREQRLSTSLAALPAAARSATFTGPVLFIIGRAAAMAAGRNESVDATDTTIAVVA